MERIFWKLLFCNIIFIQTSFALEFIVATSDSEKIKSNYSVQSLKPMFLGAHGFPRLQKYFLVKFSELYQAGSLKQSLAQKKFVFSATENASFDLHNLVVAKRNLAKRSDFFPYQWALENTGQYLIEHPSFDSPVSIQGLAGFDFSYEYLKKEIFPLLKEEVLVSVIDSGIDLTHPDLKGRIYQSPDQCGKAPTEPSDQNPFPNDCRGYNFVAPHYTKQALVTDYYGHGTHTSGIIAANDEDGIGISGISPVAKILPAKVYLSDEDLEGFEGDTVNNVSALSVYVAQALYYSIIRGAKIINLSLGWPPVLNIPVMKELIEIADENEIIVVASSGNDNSFSQVKPCAYKSVVCVGAMGIQGEYAKWSNYGAHVDFAAPGTAILSSFPNNKSKRFPVQLWELMDGSSQSGPYIAGLFSILKSLYPQATRDELFERMYRSSSTGYPKSLSLKPDVKLFLKEMDQLPPRVYFDLKENNRIEFNKEARGELRISYEVFGGDVFQSSMVVSFSDSSIQTLSRNCQIEDKIKTCTFQLQADFEHATQLLEVDMEVQLGDVKEKALAYFHMGRELGRDFTYPLEQKRQDGFVSPESYNGIRSMMGQSPGPFYYGIAKKGSIRKLELRNFENDAELLFEIEIDEKQDLSAVYLGDFNYDEEVDFLLVFSAITANDYETGRQYLYLKKDGSRLFPEFGKMKLYDPRIGIDSLNISSLTWMKTPLSKGRFIAMPAFWANRKYYADKSFNPIYGSTVMHPFGFYSLEPK
ncbi:MAG: S8 family serine peptidase, partial [Bdellovibrionota bacterium]|nr:S8 family serine peptidase [Bdellovibrionota bacterium]